MKIGIIGAGRIGKIHAENIHKYFDDVTLKSIADPYIDEVWANGLNIAVVSKNADDVLGDDDIDAVFICSASDSHASFIIAAAERGKHVFCEKPIALTIDDARKAIAAVRANGVKLQVGFNRRFDSDFLAMRQRISNGDVGDVHTLKIISRDPEPPPLSYLQSSSDIFSDMTIHDFDMLRYLSGAEVESVYVNGGRLIEHEFDQPGYIDTAFINATLSNGAIAIIENSRQAVFGYDQRAEVFGTKGSVRNDNRYPNSVTLESVNGQQKEKPLYFFLERYKESFVTGAQYFFDAIRNDTETYVTGEDALQASIIAKACRISVDEKRLVRIDEI